MGALVLSQWLARLRWAFSRSWRARRDDAIEEQKRAAKEAGRLYDAYSDQRLAQIEAERRRPRKPPVRRGPVRLEVVVRGRGVWQPMDLGGRSAERFMEEVLLAPRGPVVLGEAFVKAVVLADAHLVAVEKEREQRRLEQARLKAEAAFEAAVEQERRERGL